MKNEQGRPLDGHSLRPFLENPQTGQWSGPDEVLTALYKWARYYDPAQQSYSLRSKHWRYIRYSNGKEELYHNAEDPYEWTNLASNPQYASTLKSFRAKLAARLPDPASAPTKTADEIWKDDFFKQHPQADANQDGKLTWPEYKAYKTKLDARKAPGNADKKKTSSAEVWKDQFFQWHPNADTNKDGVLSWPEYHAHKAKVDARKALQGKKKSSQ
jgi:hypothetical protein